MRSLKEIMEEMGFNKEASYETQKAFVKHLIASANQLDCTKVEKKTSENKIDAKTKVKVGEQLEFDLSSNKYVGPAA